MRAEALRVAVECVIREPHLGGWGWVGGGELLVSVIGREGGMGGGDGVRGVGVV